MLSGAAIQKLERYAQLGLKRHGADDFVWASLKDPKRSNIYALTHLPTWQEALQEVSGGAQQQVRRVTDQLFHAMRFATLLVRHHMHATILEDGEADAAVRSQVLALLSPEVIAKRKEWGGHAAVFNSFGEAAGLLSVLREIVVCCAASSSSGSTTSDGASSSSALSGIHIPYSAALIEALSELVKVLVDVLLLLQTSALVHLSATSSGQHPSLLGDEVLVMLGAAIRLLRRAVVALPNEPAALQQKMTAAAGLKPLLRQALTPHSNAKTGNGDRQEVGRAEEVRHTNQEDDVRPDALQLYYEESLLKRREGGRKNHSAASTFSRSVLLQWCAMLDCGTSSFLDGFSLFQRLALLFHHLEQLTHSPEAAAAAMVATSQESEGQQQQKKGPLRLSSERRLQYTAALRGHLCRLLAPIACSREAQWVVCYHGDEVRLIQHSVTDASRYSLYTYATAAPVEPSLCQSIVTGCMGSCPPSSSQSPSWRRRSALHLLVWVVSIPYFFTCFCAHDGWRAMSREQRRAVLTSRATDSRLVARRERKAKQLLKRSSSSSTTGSIVNGSTASAASTMNSARSTAFSRASRLSLLSASSAATYQSFLSALPPELDAEGDRGLTAEGGTGAMFYSALGDVNTNLATALLEECVLALDSFGRAFSTSSSSFLRVSGLADVRWEAVSAIFQLMHESLRVAGGVDTTAARSSTSIARLLLSQPLFEMGDDIQFNCGRGFEALALVFSVVFVPALEQSSGSSSNSLLLPGAAPAEQLDEEQEAAEKVRKQQQQQCLAALMTESSSRDLSICLSVYEAIAPHVVDQYLPTILHMVSHAMVCASSSHKTTERLRMDASGTDDTAAASLLPLQFFRTLMLRLGKSNQLVHLLKAMHLWVRQEPERAPGVLFHAFHLPLLRETYTQSCESVLDVEEVLSLIITYFTALSEEEEEQQQQQQQEHQSLAVRVWWCSIAAYTLVGLPCTSSVSRRVLELSTELELLICSCLATAFTSPSQGQECWRPLLWRAGLEALYQCRELTHSCLKDLGGGDDEPVVSVIRMLEEVLWQASTRPDILCGPSYNSEAVIEALRLSPEQQAAFEPQWQAAAFPPHLVLTWWREGEREVVPCLLLQRLKLVQTVEALLLSSGEEVVDRATLKPLKRTLLKYLPGILHRLTEDDWSCIGHWCGGSSHFKDVLVNMLRDQQRQVISSDAPTQASWAESCLPNVRGALLRAASEAFLGIHRSSSSTSNNDHAAAVDEKGLVDVLVWIYNHAGLNPYWPMLVDHSLRLCEKADDGCLHSSSFLASLFTLLVQCLRAEQQASSVMVEALCKHVWRKNITEEGSASGSDTAYVKAALRLIAGKRSSSTSHKKGKAASSSAAQLQYLQRVGVPLAALSQLDDDDEDVELEEGDHRSVCTFTEELDHISRVLMRSDLLSALHLTPVSTSGSDSSAAASLRMAVLYSLYTVLLSAADRTHQHILRLEQQKSNKKQEEEDVSIRSVLVSLRASESQLVEAVLRIVASFSASSSTTTKGFAQPSHTTLSALVAFLTPYGTGSATEYSTSLVTLLPAAKSIGQHDGIAESVRNAWRSVFHEVLAASLQQITEPSARQPTDGATLTMLSRAVLLLYTHLSQSVPQDSGAPAVKGGAHSKGASSSSQQTLQQLKAVLFHVDGDASTELTPIASRVVQQLTKLFSSSSSSSDSASLLAAYASRLVRLSVAGNSSSSSGMGSPRQREESAEAGWVSLWVTVKLAQVVEAGNSGSRNDAMTALGDNLVQVLSSQQQAVWSTSSDRSVENDDTEKISFLLLQLSACRDALSVIHASSAPAALHRYLHSLLRQVLALTSSTSVATATMLQRLCIFFQRLFDHVPKLRAANFTSSLSKVLKAVRYCSAGVTPAVAAVSNEEQGEGLRQSSPEDVAAMRAAAISLLLSPTVSLLLTSSSAPAGDARHHQEESAPEETLAEECWQLVGHLALTSSTSSATSHLVTEDDMVRLIYVITRLSSVDHSSSSSMSLLRTQQLPLTLALVFKAILEGVADQSFSARPLHALSTLFYQLVRSASADSRKRGRGNDDEDEDDDANGVAEEDETHTAGAASSAARQQAASNYFLQQRRHLLCASIMAAVYQLCAPLLAVFSSHTAETDAVVQDMLMYLQRFHLPNPQVRSLSFRPSAAHRSQETQAFTSMHTTSDLLYTAVGAQDGKALMRQAALRIEEQHGIAGGTREGKQLFHVPA